MDNSYFTRFVRIRGLQWQHMTISATKCILLRIMSMCKVHCVDTPKNFYKYANNYVNMQHNVS